MAAEGQACVLLGARGGYILDGLALWGLAVVGSRPPSWCRLLATVRQNR